MICSQGQEGRTKTHMRCGNSSIRIERVWRVDGGGVREANLVALFFWPVHSTQLYMKNRVCPCGRMIKIVVKLERRGNFIVTNVKVPELHPRFNDLFRIRIVSLATLKQHVDLFFLLGYSFIWPIW